MEKLIKLVTAIANGLLSLNDDQYDQHEGCPKDDTCPACAGAWALRWKLVSPEQDDPKSHIAVMNTMLTLDCRLDEVFYLFGKSTTIRKSAKLLGLPMTLMDRKGAIRRCNALLDRWS